MLPLCRLSIFFTFLLCFGLVAAPHTQKWLTGTGAPPPSDPPSNCCPRPLTLPLTRAPGVRRGPVARRCCSEGSVGASHTRKGPRVPLFLRTFLCLAFPFLLSHEALPSRPDPGLRREAARLSGERVGDDRPASPPHARATLLPARVCRSCSPPHEGRSLPPPAPGLACGWEPRLHGVLGVLCSHVSPAPSA